MARRCGIPHPPTPTSVSARSLGGSAAHPALRGRFGPATGHPASARCGGAACTRPGRGVWLARRGGGGGRSGSPERRRRRRGLLRHRGTVSAPQPARPPARPLSLPCRAPRPPPLPAPPRTLARPLARHADLCSRGRRLRFARSSSEGGSALAQPSSRRLSFSARRRRSGGGECAGSTPGRAGGARRAGGAGRRGARAPTERARAAGRELRVAGVSARAADARLVAQAALPNRRPYRCVRGARRRSRRSRRSRSAGPQGRAAGLRTDRWGPPRPLPHGVSGALLQLTFKEAREQPQQQKKKVRKRLLGPGIRYPSPRRRRPQLSRLDE